MPRWRYALLSALSTPLSGCTHLFEPEVASGDEEAPPACSTLDIPAADLENTFCSGAPAPPAGDGSWAGTFAVSQTIAGQGTPCELAVADLDGDQDLDIVVAAVEDGESPAKNLILWDEIDERFVAVEFEWDLREVVVADVDCNGDIDLVGTGGGCNRGRLEIAYNGGPARFSRTEYDSLCNAGPVDFGDLNGDGAAEIVIGGGSSGALIHLGGDPGSTCTVDDREVYIRMMCRSRTSMGTETPTSS